MSEKNITLPVTGMTSANCAMNIERTLTKKVSGVVKASVNFATERVRVEYVPGLTSLDEMIDAIEKIGYGAIRPDDAIEGEDAEQAAHMAEIKNQTRKYKATGQALLNRVPFGEFNRAGSKGQCHDEEALAWFARLKRAVLG